MCELRNGAMKKRRRVFEVQWHGEGNINPISYLLRRSGLKAKLERCSSRHFLIPSRVLTVGSLSVINGFDRDGRPIIYMRPGNENTKTSPRQLRHLVYCLYVPIVAVQWFEILLTIHAENVPAICYLSIKIL